MSSIQEGNNSLTNQSLPQVENQSNSNRSDSSRAESLSTQEENTPPQVENQSNTGSDSDHPDPPCKLWNIQDPFKYAPPKPEGDPWALLLDPLIKNDKAQCDAWKEDVQNLLIFAGLFSAVVTAFIVESYKNLQADPNDTIVTLLSQIALQTDRSLNATAVKLEPAHPFVPTSSSIRVNVFWFLSLILNLATVVIGIVSLQWLREHQSYESDLSPRTKYALFNMRADGLKAWHVDKIFTSLPLLLQFALVLFLGGVIDFLHAIGYWAVTIPVMIAISFILMFLIATTLLPCLQVILLIPYTAGQTSKHIDPPSQCPYKSPQSRAIRRIFRLLHRPKTFHHLRQFLVNVKAFSKQLLAGYPGPFYSAANDFDAFNPSTAFKACLSKAFKAQWWAHFDLAWLCIRDAYMGYSFSNRFRALGFEESDTFPIHDALAGVLSQRYQKSTAHSAYHCFDEISLMNDRYWGHKRDTYFHRLLSNFLGPSEVSSLNDFLYMPFTDTPDAESIYVSVLRQQGLLRFVGVFPTYQQPVAVYRQHRLELYIRLVGYVYEYNKLHRSRENLCSTIPKILTIEKDFYSLFNKGEGPEGFPDIMWQLGTIALSALQDLESNGRMYSIPFVFIQQYDLTEMMLWVGYVVCNAVETSVVIKMRTERSTPTNFQERYASIIIFLEDQMTSHVQALTMSAESDSEHRPCLLFYLAAICCHRIRVKLQDSPTSFYTLFTMVMKYKELTIDCGVSDPGIETALRNACSTDYDLFCDAWWGNIRWSFRHTQMRLTHEA